MPVAGIGAVVTEWFCYRHFSSDERYPDLRNIILANLVSWFVGIVITAFLPGGLIDKVLPGDRGHTVVAAGRHFTTFAVTAFLSLAF
ncbi:MAG TPA: hypothetical protein VFB55_08615 [Verrucomicrobiae bacterium]|nr:hypothetical protein [Verrucomicrobiae bacterium]